MNKRILIITLAALGLSFLVSSCVKNSELEGKVKDIVQLDSLNARMAALEARMKGINTDIATLKTAVEALRKNLYVTNVEQTTDGFKLTFSNGKTVTIKNGKDGKDGKNAPVVGVKDSLGTYYWVLVDKTQTLADTSWILDKELKKIPVSGKDGAEVGVKDTLTSVYWVKIDKSKSPADTTWLMDKDSNLVQAVGKDGESIFSGIDTTKTGYVVLTLASGTKIELPYKSELDKLVSRIQSVEVIPEYQDGSVGIKKSGTVTVSFEVRPASLLDSIVTKKGKDAFSLLAVETKAVTKAVTYDTLEVTGATVGDDSLLTLTVAKGGLHGEFFDSTKFFNARLHISDGNTDRSSAYFPLNPISVKYPEAPELECVEINGTVWAPVNCGYDATKYTYGKLYQWGRVYPCEYNATWTDGGGNHTAEVQLQATTQGPVAADSEKSNEFYKNSSSPNDWLTPQNNKRWNDGSDASPVKTSNDPCPTGWRVPTAAELISLLGSRTSGSLQDGAGVYEGMKGQWFDGSTSSEPSSGVFLPAAGFRYPTNGDAGRRSSNNASGGYWSSSVNGLQAKDLSFYSGSTYIGNDGRAYGMSVRCVQE